MEAASKYGEIFLIHEVLISCTALKGILQVVKHIIKNALHVMLCLPFRQLAPKFHTHTMLFLPWLTTCVFVHELPVV